MLSLCFHVSEEWQLTVALHVVHGGVESEGHRPDTVVAVWRFLVTCQVLHLRSVRLLSVQCVELGCRLLTHHQPIWLTMH